MLGEAEAPVSGLIVATIIVIVPLRSNETAKEAAPAGVFGELLSKAPYPAAPVLFVVDAPASIVPSAVFCAVPTCQQLSAIDVTETDKDVPELVKPVLEASGCPD